MTRVERIELREIRLPLKEPFRISSGLCTERRIMLLHLWDADGMDVWSECVAGEAPNYTSETIDTAWYSIGEYVAPRVLGVEFAHPSEVDAVLELNFRGHNMAKAAIEMGIWGLTSVREKISLSRLLGGTREGIETGISIGIQANPAALVERVARAIGDHYRKIKMKIQPGSDVEFVRAVRSAYPNAPLMADANNAYTLADTDRLKQLDDLDLIMIEQPLAFDDIIRHAQHQRMLKTPI
jgi:O-succinylbenzoate synthase